MVINIIRHGQSTANKSREYPYPDTPLTELGIEQANKSKEAIGEIVEGTKIYISPYKRAIETAKNLGLEGTIVEEIREMEYGEIMGLKFDEIKNEKPEIAKGMLSYNQDYKLPGGESINSFLQRAYSYFDKIIEKGESVTLISHDGIMKGLFCYLYGSDDFFNITTDNLGLMRIEIFGDTKVLKYFNRIYYNI